MEGIKISPNNLIFTLLSGSGIISQKLKVYNRSSINICFKIKCSIPYKYHLSQPTGKLHPGEMSQVIVTLQPSASLNSGNYDYLYVLISDADTKEVICQKTILLQIVCENYQYLNAQNLYQQSSQDSVVPPPFKEKCFKNKECKKQCWLFCKAKKCGYNAAACKCNCNCGGCKTAVTLTPCNNYNTGLAPCIPTIQSSKFPLLRYTSSDLTTDNNCKSNDCQIPCQIYCSGCRMHPALSDGLTYSIQEDRWKLLWLLIVVLCLFVIWCPTDVTQKTFDFIFRAVPSIYYSSSNPYFPYVKYLAWFILGGLLISALMNTMMSRFSRIM